MSPWLERITIYKINGDVEIGLNLPFKNFFFNTINQGAEAPAQCILFLSL